MTTFCGDDPPQPGISNNAAPNDTMSRTRNKIPGNVEDENDIKKPLSNARVAIRFADWIRCYSETTLPVLLGNTSR